MFNINTKQLYEYLSSIFFIARNIHGNILGDRIIYIKCKQNTSIICKQNV